MIAQRGADDRRRKHRREAVGHDEGGFALAAPAGKDDERDSEASDVLAGRCAPEHAKAALAGRDAMPVAVGATAVATPRQVGGEVATFVAASESPG